MEEWKRQWKLQCYVRKREEERARRRQEESEAALRRQLEEA